jgi:tetratricopeptide (TPR) repeat protein
MLASTHDLEKAVALLDNTPEANLKQVRALQSFEKSLSNMSLHRYEACSDGFQRCVKLNNWSHALYYFVAGVAYVELYRELSQSDPKSAGAAKAKATELLKKAPEHVGKKKIMGKQLPFDAFVGRKLQKWERRAKEWKCDLVEAIGVAPIEEMIYFWNGYKRMSPEHLDTSLIKLDWANSDANPHWSLEDVDEISILNLLKGVVLRNLGRITEAREYLHLVLSHSWVEFKGGLKDNWPLPVAHYEIAVTYWKDYCEDGNMSHLTEAKKWLDKAVGWEAYDLDAR